MSTYYPIVPGRGIVSDDATTMRRDYLNSFGISLERIPTTTIPTDQIRNNIESFIGSVEVPVGLLGSLLFNEKGKEEFVFAAAATLEGALIASINRGTRALSLSGGFRAEVLHQKMIRSPMFIFENLSQSVLFKNTVAELFYAIKTVAWVLVVLKVKKRF